MAYRYYVADASINGFTSASAGWVNDFQANLNYMFDNASDLQTIQEETSFSSGSYADVVVRINRGINSYTGEKLGDDFKLIIFKELDHSIDLGRFYYFDSNYWLTYNTETIRNLASSCIVRRCNNVLRWMDSDGSILQTPCVIDYAYKNPRDQVIKASGLTTPGGYIRIYTQQNSDTNKIKENQRFLFGYPDNWVCLKVYGGGLHNFDNLETLDNSTQKLLTLEVAVSYINEDTDDVSLGIADRYTFTTSSSSVNNIVVTPNSGSILEGDSQLFDVRYYSGSVVVSGSFVFSINDDNVPTGNYSFATIDENTFSVENTTRYLDYPLAVLCSGSSGSRIFNIDLRGDW